ncbi:MAG: DUF4105 domain-containing protein [Leptospiraceae bacterium]|nr:DUF4105 domain-containing protein [Leptospiraceae bacterium]
MKKKKTLITLLYVLICLPVLSEEPREPDVFDGSIRDSDFRRFDAHRLPADAPEGLRKALEKAEQLKTWEEVRWQKLMHYEPALGGGWKSEADAYEFFFSDEGKTNPRAELRSTLMAFYLGKPEDPQKHPICHFPARFLWLGQKLQLSAADLPRVNCSNLQNWLNIIDAHSVSVVFATYYGSNPASMYGHTFLKMNSREEDPLLDYAINYAATPGDVDPIRYALYGLLGQFPGFFSMMPYHMKVREYSDLESRDLWEYELKLTNEEKLYMLLHSWELGGIYFDYYYLTENCSYHILSLIEVARPDLSLKSEFPGWVLPAETIKILFRRHGLIQDIHYRPSLYNEIQSKLSQMGRNKRLAVEELLDSADEATDSEILTPFEDFGKAEILDVTLKAHLYFKQKDGLDEEQSARLQRLMKLRSDLPGFRTDPLPEILNSPPEAGHAPMNIRINAGAANLESPSQGSFSRTYTGLYFRPVLHDYLGPQEGYEPYSVFEFLTGELRLYNDEASEVDGQRMELEEFHLLRVESYSPVNMIRSPFSYSVDFGVEQEQYELSSDFYSADALVALTNPDLALYQFLEDGRFAWDSRLQQRHNPFARVLFGYTFRDEFGDISSLLEPFVFSVLGGVSLEGQTPDRSGLRWAPMARTLLQGQFGFLRIGLEGVYRGIDDGRAGLFFSGGYSFGRNQELRWRIGAEKWKTEMGVSYSYYF